VRRATVRRLAAAALLFATSPAAAEPITLETVPIRHLDLSDPNQARFGALTFLGGLVIRSRDPDFGGLSGLRLDPSGERLTAVSDRGRWFRARVVRDGTRITGLADGRLAPMLGPHGPLPGSRDFDTESLEIAGGTAWVGIERTNKIMRFEANGGDFAGTRGIEVRLPAEMRRGVPRNGSYEAIGLVPRGHPHAGALVVVTERQFDAAGNHVAWLLRRGKAERFAVLRRDGYAISDLAMLPSGDILLLERRYRPPLSLTARLRRLPLAAVWPGATVDGSVLAEFSLAQDIDNMESIDAHAAPRGKTVVTLVSDDNFSAFERTLLLQFELGE
jgi:hypothetical protein